MSMIINPYAFGGVTVQPPVLTWAGKGLLVGSSTGVTLNLNIGPPSADRRVILMTHQYLDDSYVFSRTINGTTPTTVWQQLLNSNYYVRVMMATIPTGTTAAVFFRTNGTISMFISAYTVTGLTNGTYFDAKGVGSGATTSSTLNVPANGFGLGLRLVGGGVNDPTITNWTGMTRDTPISGDAASTRNISSAHFETVSPVTARTVSASANYAGRMALISFGNGS